MLKPHIVCSFRGMWNQEPGCTPPALSEACGWDPFARWGNVEGLTTHTQDRQQRTDAEMAPAVAPGQNFVI